MSAKAQLRQKRERLDCRYREIGEIGDPCLYCGVPSDTWDHVPALIAAEHMKDLEIDIGDLRKFPACNQCNSFLGSVRIDSVPERRSIVLKVLRRKYAKHLAMPDWSEEELAELSDEFADDVRRHSRFASFIRQRTAWARTGGRI